MWILSERCYTANDLKSKNNMHFIKKIQDWTNEAFSVAKNVVLCTRKITETKTFTSCPKEESDMSIVVEDVRAFLHELTQMIGSDIGWVFEKVVDKLHLLFLVLKKVMRWQFRPLQRKWFLQHLRICKRNASPFFSIKWGFQSLSKC